MRRFYQRHHCRLLNSYRPSQVIIYNIYTCRIHRHKYALAAVHCDIDIEYISETLGIRLKPRERYFRHRRLRQYLAVAISWYYCFLASAFYNEPNYESHFSRFVEGDADRCATDTIKYYHFYFHCFSVYAGFSLAIAELRRHCQWRQSTPSMRPIRRRRHFIADGLICRAFRFRLPALHRHAGALMISFLPARAISRSKLRERWREFPSRRRISLHSPGLFFYFISRIYIRAVLLYH